MLAAREPMLYLGRALISAFVMAFFSVLYLKTRECVQQQAIAAAVAVNRVTAWLYTVELQSGYI
tara:strand:+ start:415 stop:606 length:192 start_codon:yes stop_codon:yes gene_type:complete